LADSISDQFFNLKEASMSLLRWIGGHTTNFLDKFNWSPQAVPNKNSDCLVEPTSPVAITVPNDATINSLVTGADATLSVVSTDTLTILGAPDASNPTGASSNAGTISLGSASDLFLDGIFTNTNKLNTVAGSDVWVNSAFHNTGAVRQSGDFTLGQTHAGTVTNAAGATWSMKGAVDISAGPAPGSTFTNAGTLTRSGAGVSDIGVATTNTGHVTVTSGLLDFVSTVVNTGTMTAKGGTLELDRAVSGVGALDIATGSLGARGTVDVTRGADKGQTVDFVGAGTLALDTPSTFGGHIKGFAGSDLINLTSTAATSESYSGTSSGGVLTVFDGLNPVAHLNMVGSYSTSSFSLSSNGHGGELIHFV
jgi:hypothetical protein